MPNQQRVEKSYKEEGAETEAFFLRTMKKDIERLRQGLPIREGVETSGASVPQKHDASQKLAAVPQAHSSTEQPPKEAAMTLPRIEARAPTLAAPPYRKETQFMPRPGENGTPTGATGPVIPQLPPLRERPIETLRAQARPAQPQMPRTGKIEVEKAQALGPALTVFERFFPTRKRLIAALGIFLVIVVVGAYAAFAYFGKPLPGTRFVFTSASPSQIPSQTPSLPPAVSKVSESPVPTPTPTVQPTIEPSPSKGPIARTAHLPISRLALVDLPQNATKIDFIERLTDFANASQSPGDFTQVIARHASTQTPLGASEFFSFLGIAAPDGFFSELEQDITLFFYAPRDAKTAAGQQAPAHFGILIPVKGSAEILKEKLGLWEATLGGDISPLAFGRVWMLGQDALFTSNRYQGALIRYQNFPDPYVAADYAIFEGSSKPLFVLTTSRESMFSVIGTLNYRSE